MTCPCLHGFQSGNTYASEPIWCDHLQFASVQGAPGCPLCKIQSCYQRQYGNQGQVEKKHTMTICFVETDYINCEYDFCLPYVQLTESDYIFTDRYLVKPLRIYNDMWGVIPSHHPSRTILFYPLHPIEGVSWSPQALISDSDIHYVSMIHCLACFAYFKLCINPKHLNVYQLTDWPLTCTGRCWNIFIKQYLGWYQKNLINKVFFEGAPPVNG